MVIKLYISGISGNKEVKKKQQRVQMILDSKQINYEAIDITEPGKEKDKEFMQQNGKVRENLGKYPLPPQIFNDDDFCGDYEDFDMANEVDELEKFLHIETSPKDLENGSKRDEKSRRASGGFFTGSKDSTDSLYNPYEYHTFTVKFDGVNGLKEEIISTNDLIEEKEKTEEVTKSEVNGESETVPSVEPSSENVAENVETTDDALVPEKEESTAKETIATDESGENLAENEEPKGYAETRDNAEEESKENVGNAEDEAESPEKSPLSKDEEEEKEEEEEEAMEEVAKDVESKEKMKSGEEDEEEEEEEESDRESEKSQEE